MYFSFFLFYFLVHLKTFLKSLGLTQIPLKFFFFAHFVDSSILDFYFILLIFIFLNLSTER